MKPVSYRSSSPTGYARVLALLLVAAAFLVWLMVTSLVVAASQLISHTADRVQALAAADSGIERALYLASYEPDKFFYIFESHEAPFVNPNYFYRVTIDRGFVRTVTATGVSGTTERVVQVKY